MGGQGQQNKVLIGQRIFVLFVVFAFLIVIKDHISVIATTHFYFVLPQILSFIGAVERWGRVTSFEMGVPRIGVKN